MSDAKTLEAYLAPPTRHKERKLNDNATSYTRLLRHTFQIDCDTQTAVNDEVTGEHLNWHSKNALKQYVPQLLDEDTFDAKHLADDHPVRYANTAATFDYDDQRDHVYCWRVPLPGRGTDFWIPLQINPGQAAEWRALLDDEDDSYTAGELRLQRDGDRWVLHVTANYEVDEQTDTTDLDDVTPVGFDVGEAQLLVGCALQDDRPTDPLLVDGSRVRDLRHRQKRGEDRLKQRDAHTLLDEYVWGELQAAIDDELEQAAADAAEYADRFENPVVVLENLAGIDEEDLGPYWNRRLGKTILRTLQARIDDQATERGIPVEYVHPHHTSKTCHACNRVGYRPHQGTFCCPFDACWVSAYQADVNAAANIAQRLNPWGESLPWKSGGDDSPRSGAPVTEPQDSKWREATLDEGAAASHDSGSTARAGAADDKGSSSASECERTGADPETHLPHAS